MLHRLPIRSRLLVAAVAACVFAAVLRGALAAAPHPAGEAAPRTALPVPAQSLALDALGYRPGASSQARLGNSTATMHFIDPEHLLLTFTSRKLMLRSKEQREGDDDHIIRAEVVHLPDGKVIRETEWRMHDRAPYLWPLGNGRFLLRERGDLYSLDPMGSFHPEELGRRMLLQSDGDIQTLQISPSGDLLLVETAPHPRVGDDPDESKDRPITADFYRVAAAPDGALRLEGRGRAVSREAFAISFTSMGVLQTVKEDRVHWGFDFHSYAGKDMELAGFTSTCRPRSIFVSDAEFFAFGCRGGDDRRLMGGFNLLAEAKWVFTIDDAPLWLSVESAPDTGRFAVRNTLATIPAQEGDRLDHDQIRAQEVRVYGSRVGDELLRVTCSPAQRPDGNYSLSPDGMKLAVMRGMQLEIYNLPPITAEEKKLHDREQAALAPLKASANLNVAVALTGGEQKSK